MEKIDTGWYDIDLSDADVVLKFYKKHRLYYENLNKAVDKTTIEEFIVVKQRYGEALEKTNGYKEATVVLEQVYKLLDRLKGKSSKYYNSFYEKSLFYEGRLLHNQKKYHESNEIFKQLIGIDPKNEKYQDWYLTNKEWVLSKKIKPLEYTALAAFAFLVLRGEKFLESYTFLAKAIVFTLFVGLFIFKRIYRKLIHLPETGVGK